MVGAHGCECAVTGASPKRVPISGRLDRRDHLRIATVAILHVLRVREVVGAGLPVHGHPERAHASNNVDLLGRRNVDDVEGTPGDAADLASGFASDKTGDGGSPFCPSRQVSPPFALQAPFEQRTYVGVLCVDHGENVGSIASQRREPIEAFVQHAVVRVADRDLICGCVLARLVSGIEVLEADDAEPGELLLPRRGGCRSA